jgi:hypothetical protein
VRGSIVATIVTSFDTDAFIGDFTLERYVEHVRSGLVDSHGIFLGSPEGVTVMAARAFEAGEVMKDHDVVQATACVNEVCPNCFSSNLRWHMYKKAGPHSPGHNLMNLNDMEVLAILACEECSETVKTMDMEEFVEKVQW